MVSKAVGSITRRKDGKYLLYIPVDLATDSMFPFKGKSVKVQISFDPMAKEKGLLVTELKENEN